MKKADKQQAEEIVTLLKHSHTLIRKMLDVRSRPIALDLLEQCQSCAISLGEKIEAVEGENAPTIPLVEQYCELTYQIYEKVKQPYPIDVKKILFI